MIGIRNRRLQQPAHEAGPATTEHDQQENHSCQIVAALFYAPALGKPIAVHEVYEPCIEGDDEQKGNDDERHGAGFYEQECKNKNFSLAKEMKAQPCRGAVKNGRGRRPVQ